MLKKITLHLARNAQFPGGSAFCGYEIVAPIDAAGRLDHEEWRRVRDRCHVRRFWQGQPERYGALIHHSGGRDGATWVIDYDPDTTDDDERGYRLDHHRFSPGEYISLSGDVKDPHTFKIIKIEDDPA